MGDKLRIMSIFKKDEKVELFAAKHKDTGQLLTRYGALIVATAEEWAEYPYGELVTFTPELRRRIVRL